MLLLETFDPLRSNKRRGDQVRRPEFWVHLRPVRAPITHAIPVPIASG